MKSESVCAGFCVSDFFKIGWAFGTLCLYSVGGVILAPRPPPKRTAAREVVDTKRVDEADTRQEQPDNGECCDKLRHRH